MLDNVFTKIDKSINYTADIPGGDKRLFETVAVVTTNITNTGTWYGRPIAQLYIGLLEATEEPTAILRGFQDAALDVGEMGMVMFELRSKDVSYWNMVEHLWDYAPETYVYVRSSAVDFHLQGCFTF